MKNIIDPMKLAYELAEALDDRDSIKVFQQLAERYSEDHLRKNLVKVLAIPADKIKKTRGALFTYLVQQHGNKYRNSCN